MTCPLSIMNQRVTNFDQNFYSVKKGKTCHFLIKRVRKHGTWNMEHGTWRATYKWYITFELSNEELTDEKL